MFSIIILAVLIVVGARVAMVYGPKIHKELNQVTNVGIFYIGLVLIASYLSLQIVSQATGSLTGLDEIPLHRNANVLETATDALESMTVFILYLSVILLPVSFIVKLSTPRKKNTSKVNLQKRKIQK